MTEMQTSTTGNTSDMPRPGPAQLAWQESELKALLQFDIHTYLDKAYWPSRGDPRLDDPNMFNPVELDTDQWVRTAKEMGAGQAIMTASHVAGFSMWQSDCNPFSLKATSWGDGKRDILAEFLVSCQKYGLKSGLFLGTRLNAYQQVFQFKATEKSLMTQEEYNNLIEAEVEELCTRYGDIFEFWFDGGAYGKEAGGPDALGIFEKHQPNGHFYHSHERADSRWGGTESGTVNYPCWATMPFDGYTKYTDICDENECRLLRSGDPDGAVWCPAMGDTPLRNHNWFWRPNEEHLLKPVDELLHVYNGSVGRNAALILGLVIDRQGLVPEPDAQRCREFGEALQKIYAEPVATTSGQGMQLELTIPKGETFDHLVIQEDIAQGERVREFRVERLVHGGPSELTTGTCIGNKRIVTFEPISARGLRLTIDAATAEPIIKTFAVYSSCQPPLLISKPESSG